MSTKTKHSHFYQLGGQILEQVESNPYLGVQISADLEWSKHIATTCKKASSTLGFLRRNLGSCPEKCRKVAYISLVRSKFDYSATVWDPHFVKDREKLERVQRQAARFIKRDYKTRDAGCVTKMLQELQLTSLQERRKQQRLTLLYKIAEGMIPALPSDSFLKPADRNKRKIRPKRFEDYVVKNLVERHAYNNTRGFKVPDASTEQYKCSFFVQAVEEWNKLEEEVVQAKSAAAFSAALCRIAATN